MDNFAYGKEDNIAHNLKNPNFKFEKADITDYETLKKLGKDANAILHLAAVKKSAKRISACQR